MNKEYSMKNTIKAFGIIALVVVIGFLMAACGDITSDKKDDVDGGDDLEAFDNWLSKQPSNTPETAYIVKRNFTTFNYYSTKGGRSIGDILKDNPTKYVSFDLSGSTGDIM